MALKFVICLFEINNQHKSLLYWQCTYSVHQAWWHKRPAISWMGGHRNGLKSDYRLLINRLLWLNTNAVVGYSFMNWACCIQYRNNNVREMGFLGLWRLWCISRMLIWWYIGRSLTKRWYIGRSLAKWWYIGRSLTKPWGSL